VYKGGVTCTTIAHVRSFSRAEARTTAEAENTSDFHGTEEMHALVKASNDKRSDTYNLVDGSHPVIELSETDSSQILLILHTLVAMFNSGNCMSHLHQQA
jgi:hypothetical protein